MRKEILILQSNQKPGNTGEDVMSGADIPWK